MARYLLISKDIMRRLLQILLALALVWQLFSCGGFTPPVACPNQCGESSPDMSSQLEELPLEPVSDQFEPDPGTGASISASPTTIYTLDLTNGVINSQTASVIRVDAGVFEPNSVIDIWGLVDNPDEIISPPYIIGGDGDVDKPYIQMSASEDGSLEFMLAAGYSPSVFQIIVTDGAIRLSVEITIQGPEEL